MVHVLKQQALSKKEQKANITNLEELRGLAKILSLQHTETTKRKTYDCVCFL
jgi:hypothetical protein